MSFTDKFYDEAAAFLTRLDGAMTAGGVSLPVHWDTDHLCYRTDSPENYAAVCRDLARFSVRLAETEVSGRMISTFKLPRALKHGRHIVDIVEVPAPKPGRRDVEGFEHAEIVMDLPFPELRDQFAGLECDEGGLKKHFNAEFEVNLPGDVNVKFHHLSLESVVRFEISPAFEALRATGLLAKLRTFDPLVAGTFPLGLDTTGSDVDLLLTITDANAVKSAITAAAGDFPEFKMRDETVDGESTVIATFKAHGTNFELFAQKTASVRQRAFRHFQIEERLLKLGGAEFAKKIHDARARGLKTEPAFAQVMGLQSDGFRELLELHSSDTRRLSNLFK